MGQPEGEALQISSQTVCKLARSGYSGQIVEGEAIGGGRSWGKVNKAREILLELVDTLEVG
jgi:hypothetical protein